MIKLQYQGYKTVMSLEELYIILSESNLPWYSNEDKKYPEIYVIGQEKDLLINGEII